MFFATFGASLLENLLTGKRVKLKISRRGVITASEGEKARVFDIASSYDQF